MFTRLIIEICVFVSKATYEKNCVKEMDNVRHIAVLSSKLELKVDTASITVHSSYVLPILYCSIFFYNMK